MKFLELVVVVLAVLFVFGYVVGIALKLGHPVEYASNYLKGAILNLQERNSVGYVLADCIQAINLGARETLIQSAYSSL